MEQPVYLTEKQVSELTKRAVNTLRSDRHHGRGLPYRKINRQILYNMAEVIDFVERHKIETDSY